MAGLRARAKITSHFQAPVHPACLRCERLKYHDIPALSRLAGQAPQHLKSFYLGLMQCFMKMERHADALATYERCRKILNDVLQVRPCSDIETLHRQLRD